VTRALIVFFALASLVGCVAPSTSSSVKVSGVDFEPKSTLYAQFDAAVGGSILTNGSIEHFAEAVAFDGDVTCEEIEKEECGSVIADGRGRVILAVLPSAGLCDRRVHAEHDDLCVS
jgi:hypothetical protein